MVSGGRDLLSAGEIVLRQSHGDQFQPTQDRLSLFGDQVDLDGPAGMDVRKLLDDATHHAARFIGNDKIFLPWIAISKTRGSFGDASTVRKPDASTGSAK